ncbi:IS607 family transposase ISTko1 [Dulcicalothrix desertica PCC 7102]|uniref:IS607 family transposase ISTko1 n=1 Tax=Dulcicalothrix desertica PCC 7102 TaxID=232991 RepID=A0A433UMB5_9CYAN|nr:IS607 family transposase [Dulcicalothrix desertica]RUS94983.1 IS607 family transposase ISTko1 [Dulcicalothrix desertica PCC 7102]TWH51438.1 putative site-specific integrase-resolvase [Dulcicalothrix desertica PCC 7102]
MYITPQEAQRRYGFHPRTLVDWANDGKIECIKSPGGHRRYSVSSLEQIKSGSITTILYARVSTSSQKDDLKTQIEYLANHYPGNECITDIGSGLNFKRKKFIQVMEKVAKGEVTNIVVAHKDRLARFGFDFIEWFCNLNGCKIIVLNNTYKPPHQEMMEDFMSIMHCFSSKLYFLRKYEKKILNEVDKTE